MATRKRTSTRRRSTPRTSRRRGALTMPSFGPGWHVSPDVARSIVGVALLAIGAVTLIALMLPGEGTLTTWWRNAFAPFFGAGRWILPFVLLAAGFYVERAPSAGGGWQLTLFGATLSFVAMLGLIDVLMLPSPRRGVELSGGYIGTALGGSLSALLSPPGAFVVLVALAIAGLLIMLDTTLHGLFAPFGRGVRGVASVLSSPSSPGADERRPATSDRQSRGPGRPLTGAERVARTPSTGHTAVCGSDAD
ncbi:MAG TPA: DNA translocase FtsK 4TM domain-containing protein [Candidatus Limnocylindrales bacterium]